METIVQKPKYVPLIQKQNCCAATCLQIILYRNGYGLLDQEQIAMALGVKIDPEDKSFSSAMPVMTKTNFDEGISTLDSVKVINNLLEDEKTDLQAEAFKFSSIESVGQFIEDHLKKDNDIWVEYHGHEIYSNDEEHGDYVHDGLIESINLQANTIVITDSMPNHKQRINLPVDLIERSISSKFGRETGFIVVSRKQQS